MSKEKPRQASEPLPENFHKAETKEYVLIKETDKAETVSANTMESHVKSEPVEPVTPVLLVLPVEPVEPVEFIAP